MEVENLLEAGVGVYGWMDGWVEFLIFLGA